MHASFPYGQQIVAGRSDPRTMSFDRRSSRVEQPEVPENPLREELKAKVRIVLHSVHAVHCSSVH